MNIPPDIWMVLVMAIACVFCWYIYPHSPEKPNKFQKYAAIFWILFKRTVCLTAVIGCIELCYIVLSSSETALFKVKSIAICLASAIGFSYVGVIGISRGESNIGLYKKVKEKYGIRW
jgi:hypothetical protein